MQFLGKGNRSGEEFRNIMEEAIEKAQAKKVADTLSKFVGTLVGFAFAAFLFPLLIVYAYNGLQPAVWPDISYLPTVAGLFAFRTLVHMARTE